MIRATFLSVVTLFAIGFGASNEAFADGSYGYRAPAPAMRMDVERHYVAPRPVARVIRDDYVAPRPPIAYSGPVRAYPTPVYSRPMPMQSSGPVCDSCGGWTRNGCYMSMRKIINYAGKAELRCVEACDAEREDAPVEGS
jgi:hypothetical protein